MNISQSFDTATLIDINGAKDYNLDQLFETVRKLEREKSCLQGEIVAQDYFNTREISKRNEEVLKLTKKVQEYEEHRCQLSPSCR